MSEDERKDKMIKWVEIRGDGGQMTDTEEEERDAVVFITPLPFLHVFILGCNSYILH